MDEKTLRELAAKADEDIDTSDAPELADWDAAEVGRFYRPVKQAVTIRLDADVIECFKRKYGRYQPAMNTVLREFCRAQGLLPGPASRKRAAK
ncbi:MAG TPA: BrnA antitoxin family protein [Desulfovibrio sp.]|jgi:uncharacterized protein (DUF4415 family)|uniref:BrnA antitoxin family protein n=1 Tax=Desulfovibrio TaxID=872 RepID=UPI002C45C9DA|nr:BrnA antitoxin family protein [Desulfovibrio sp.]HMM38902.1 BrnA antitoxin family protein [Desulfovibrio sp.]